MSSLLAHIFKGRTYLVFGFSILLILLIFNHYTVFFKTVLAARTVIKKRRHFTQSRRIRVTLTVTASPVPAMQGTAPSQPSTDVCGRKAGAGRVCGTRLQSWPTPR